MLGWKIIDRVGNVLGGKVIDRVGNVLGGKERVECWVRM